MEKSFFFSKSFFCLPDAEGGSGDRTEGGRGLGHLGLVLLVTLVPATLIGVVAVLTFLFTSCKYTKLIHLVIKQALNEQVVVMICQLRFKAQVLFHNMA